MSLKLWVVGVRALRREDEENEQKTSEKVGGKQWIHKGSGGSTFTSKNKKNNTPTREKRKTALGYFLTRGGCDLACDGSGKSDMTRRRNNIKCKNKRASRSFD